MKINKLTVDYAVPNVQYPELGNVLGCEVKIEATHEGKKYVIAEHILNIGDNLVFNTFLKLKKQLNTY